MGVFTLCSYPLDYVLAWRGTEVLTVRRRLGMLLEWSVHVDWLIARLPRGRQGGWVSSIWRRRRRATAMGMSISRLVFLVMTTWTEILDQSMCYSCSLVDHLLCLWPRYWLRTTCGIQWQSLSLLPRWVWVPWWFLRSERSLSLNWDHLLVVGQCDWVIVSYTLSCISLAVVPSTAARILRKHDSAALMKTLNDISDRSGIDSLHLLDWLELTSQLTALLLILRKLEWRGRSFWIWNVSLELSTGFRKQVGCLCVVLSELT